MYNIVSVIGAHSCTDKFSVRDIRSNIILVSVTLIGFNHSVPSLGLSEMHISQSN